MADVAMNEAPSPPRGFLAQLQQAQLVLAACALVVMSLVTVVDVMLRYLLNRPVRGSYDLVECMLVVFVFHGLATVFLNRQNIVIDLIDGVASPGLRTALIRISDVLQIAVLGVYASAMLSPAWQAFDYGDRKLELGLPVYVIWIFALAGIAGTIVCAVGALVSTPIPPQGARPA
jgi:TRAP-type C4-dicarboxylate transport system permease small subunit